MPSDTMLDELLNRYSTPARELSEPAPDDAQINTMLRAAVTAPDHGRLRPWQFVLIRGEARRALGDAMAEAYLARNPDAEEAEIQKQRKKPLRSPLIIAVAARITRDHPKVPEQEQVLSAGCAAQHIQFAARALGYDSIWLTGPAAYDWSIANTLGFGFDDKIVGFIYIGTRTGPPASVERPDPGGFLREWHPSDSGAEQ